VGTQNTHVVAENTATGTTNPRGWELKTPTRTGNTTGTENPNPGK